MADNLDHRKISNILKELRKVGGRRPQLQVDFDDERVDWKSFGIYTEQGKPSIGEDQEVKYRWTLDDGRALHSRWIGKRGHVRFHLDRRDPTSSPFGHLLEDTYAPHGALVGALVGGLTSGRAGGALAGMIMGGAGGTLFDPGPSSVWVLASLEGDGQWRVRRVDERWDTEWAGTLG
ncbi:MAG: hypothetical protein MJE77_04780 [Proteobacteria bacterium]|nr:hypothetical protein [Pseudomonadota bacterium]